MKTYLVGGAVRDELLGRPVVEKDYVVVGAMPQDLIAKGYQPVGKDFPVFLHPQTKAEYALARTERKTGKGHTGFECYASPTVTLEEDLIRRDLTLNAIAKDHEGNLIDPFGGIQDLKKRILKQVSAAFTEDPLRVYRVARFMAQLGDFEFSIDAALLVLMKHMVRSGECNSLSGERIWREVYKALESPHTEKFFEVLTLVGLSNTIWGGHIPFQPSVLPPGLNNLNSHPMIKYALYFHEINPPFTPPKKYAELSQLFKALKTSYQNIQNMDAKDIESFFSKCDLKRRPARFALFIKTCEIFFQSSEQKPDIEKLIDAYLMPAPKTFFEQYSGAELKQILRDFRIKMIVNALP